MDIFCSFTKRLSVSSNILSSSNLQNPVKNLHVSNASLMVLSDRTKVLWTAEPSRGIEMSLVCVFVHDYNGGDQ